MMRSRLLKKLIWIYSAILVATFLLLEVVVSSIVNANNEDTIAKEMTGLKANCVTYIKQSIRMNDLPANEESFQLIAGSAVGEMSAMLSREFGFYETDGTLIYAYFTADDASWSHADLSHAVAGENAYTIVRGRNAAYVYFSFPMVMFGTTLGIVRVRCDYTALYENSSYMLRIVLYGGMGMLGVALLMLVWIIAEFISPIKRLSVAIQETSAHPDSTHLLPVTRRDEIGELIAEYNKMAATIRAQLQTIETEKRNLQQTLEYRKNFYDNLTHELKTPMTIVLGYAEMIQQTDFRDPAFNKKGIDQIVAESKRLCDMVTGLLEVSRETGKISQQMTDVDLSELLYRLIASMNIKANRYGSRIDAEILPNVHVRGVADELHKLFVNLLDNAIKYGVPERPAGVWLREEDGWAYVRIWNFILKEIPSHEFERIFLPFYRSRTTKKREAGSVGLGLSICKGIVDAHSGNISAKMIDQDRIAFDVKLPLAGQEDA